MEMKTFYIIGFFCFLIVASFSLVTLILDFKQMRISSFIATSANIFFYFVLSWFFFGEYKKQNNTVEINTQDVLQELSESK